MNLLEEIINKKHYNFIEKEVTSWEEAIRLSCDPLLSDKTIEESYVNLLIESVKKYGPYIVLLPNMAMPHSTENAVGVNETAICFTRFSKPVSFDLSDPSKDAQYFFTLAASNHDAHLKNMEQLFTLFTDEEIFNEVMQIKDLSDLGKIAKKINS
ncbi:MAG: PTS sugar transporter subunit IIA [Acholeplasmatales bacterium]|jgi:PTS system ascorbate-specific IIA component|nr:PTS sugar transporter subunit IIA [Acholeplasmatales bacterium]